MPSFCFLSTLCRLPHTRLPSSVERNDSKHPCAIMDLLLLLSLLLQSAVVIRSQSFQVFRLTPKSDHQLQYLKDLFEESTDDGVDSRTTTLHYIILPEDTARPEVTQYSRLLASARHGRQSQRLCVFLQRTADYCI